MRLPLPAGLLLAALALAACGTGGGDDEGTPGGEDRLRVVTGFYPLTYAVERVAGDHAQVTSLTAAGVDPHDVELSPRDVVTVGEADLVVHLAGLQPAVDTAVAEQAADRAVDVTGAADLVPTGAGDHTGEPGAEQHDSAEHALGDGHDHGGVDPHFWLDPQRYADVAAALADRLAETDPEHAEDYRANLDAFRSDLAGLDAAFAQGLADCGNTHVVTTHAAFGYLTERYGLTQVGMTGLAPEAEPSPARLAEISRAVADLGVDTIYAEVLAGPEVAETVAEETGAGVRLLDPVEGISDASPGEDYLEVMRANLETLRAGQGCS